MNYLDILLLIPVAWAVFTGFKKGFVESLFGLLAIFAGIYAGIHFSEWVADGLKSAFDWTSESLPAVSFAITFLAVVIVVYMIGRLAAGMVKSAGLGALDTVMGVVFSVMKTVLMLSVVLLFFNYLNRSKELVPKERMEESLLWKPVEGLVPFLMPAVRESAFYRSIERELSGQPTEASPAP